jgi:hypothetical protein
MPQRDWKEIIINVVVFLFIFLGIPVLIMFLFGGVMETLTVLETSYNEMILHPETWESDPVKSVKKSLLEFVLFFSPKRRGSERDESARENWSGLTVYAVIIFILGLIMGPFGMFQLRKALKAQKWPSVTGVIAESRLISKRMGRKFRGGSVFVPVIKYDYEADGRSYRGSKIYFMQGYSNIYRNGQKYIDRYPEGCSVKVYYNPKDPQTAVLENDRISKFSIIFGSFGILTYLSLLIYFSLFLIVQIL